MSNTKITRVISSIGTTRVFEFEDGSLVERQGGSASWRNNNPGNLKFEFAGSVDTVHNHRSKPNALHDAQRRYAGVVDLDQHGNAIFESPETGRAAQLQHLRTYGPLTVEQMLEHYSKPDYSGPTHHAAQARTIHATAQARGLDLHSKHISAMSAAELDALGAGIAKFEGFRVGETRAVAGIAHAQHATAPLGRTGPTAHDLPRPHPAPHPPTMASGTPDSVDRPAMYPGSHALPAASQHTSTAHAAHPHVLHGAHPRHAEHAGHTLATGADGAEVRTLQHALNTANARDAQGHRLAEDGRFGRHTHEAVADYQARHRLPVSGLADARTCDALHRAPPGVDDPAHPAHHHFTRALDRIHAAEVERGIAHGPHSHKVAGAVVARMQADGLERIDRVELSHDGRYVRGVQVHPTRDEAGLNRATLPIETATAVQQSIRENATRVDVAARQPDMPDTTMTLRSHAIPGMAR